MKTLIDMKCPSCGAALEVEEGREYTFCQFCGTKILINDENKYTYRHIDDADVKRAETDQMIQLKKMELAEKENARKLKFTIVKIIISLILATAGILMFVLGEIKGSKTGDPDSGYYAMAFMGLFPLMGAGFVWLFSPEKDNASNESNNKIIVPNAISTYRTKNYVEIKALLMSAGFTNIRCLPLNCMNTILLEKAGTVKSISINGYEITSGGKKFPLDANVIITYYSN